MSFGFDSGVVIQTAERYHRNAPARIEARHLRAASLAKHLREVLGIGHLVKRQVVFALGKLDAIHRRKPVGRVRGGAGLAASMAVAILHQRKGFANLVYHGATQAAAPHDAFRPGFERFLFHTLHPGVIGVVVVPG